MTWKVGLCSFKIFEELGALNSVHAVEKLIFQTDEAERIKY